MAHGYTRNISKIKVSTLVADVIQGALNRYYEEHDRKGIEWKETYTFSFQPTLEWPYTTSVALHGHTRFECGCAFYDGPYGRWKVYLKGHGGAINRRSWADQQIMEDELTDVLGTPKCMEPSDVYKEDKAARQQRARDLIASGVLA